MKLYAVADVPPMAFVETVQVGVCYLPFTNVNVSVRILQWIMAHYAIENNARLLPSFASRTSNGMFDEFEQQNV